MSEDIVWSPMPIEPGSAPYRPPESDVCIVSDGAHLDAKAVFTRSAYMVIEPPIARSCSACGFDHGVWTHGCRPIAYPRTVGFYPGHRAYEVPDNAIPNLLTRGCRGIADDQPLPDPHEHQDFRWQ